MVKVLLIDDDEMLRNALKAVLVSKNYEVVLAVNGKEGLNLYREQKIDVVITDIVMPEKEGIETIIDFQKDFPEAKIIVISGGGLGSAGDYLKMAQTMPNVLRTLSKPISSSDLCEAIQEIAI